MTIKDWRKAFKQLRAKPVKMQKYIKHNEPRKRPTGSALKRCRRCGRFGGHISKYGMHLCRTCFRDVAVAIGFKKFS